MLNTILETIVRDKVSAMHDFVNEISVKDYLRGNIHAKHDYGDKSVLFKALFFKCWSQRAKKI